MIPSAARIGSNPSPDVSSPHAIVVFADRSTLHPARCYRAGKTSEDWLKKSRPREPDVVFVGALRLVSLRPVSSELALELSSDAGVGILTGIAVPDIGGGRRSRRVRPDGTGRPENFRPRRAAGFTHGLIRLGARFAGDGRSGTQRSDDNGGGDHQP